MKGEEFLEQLSYYQLVGYLLPPYSISSASILMPLANLDLSEIMLLDMVMLG
jgi:hypothetical protein